MPNHFPALPWLRLCKAHNALRLLAFALLLAMPPLGNTAFAQTASPGNGTQSGATTQQGQSIPAAPAPQPGTDGVGGNNDSAPPPTPVAHCDTDHISLCEDTNELIWSKGFADQVGAFIGEGTASWLYANGSRIDQMIEVLGGPPQVRQKVGDDLWLYGACRAHSCPEKGAVIVSSKGDITAAAILHFTCTTTCQDDYTLTIIGANDDKTLSDAIQNWAQTTINDDARTYKKANPPKIAKVEHLGPAGAGQAQPDAPASNAAPATTNKG